MKWGRVTMVVLGACIITALGIDAADTLKGNDGTLLSQVIKTRGGACPSGMAEVSNIPTLTCVDMYEASAHEKCPVTHPEQILATTQNLNVRECISESKRDALPWRFITRDQAMQVCARGGKRLPTNEEWYALTLGMASVEMSCNISTRQTAQSGKYAECVAPSGAYDLVGNVWEWVSDDVIDGAYMNVHVPRTGYVAQIDSTGMATIVSEEPQDLFEKDYFWSREDGAYGIIRGGYYDSGSDAGMYTVHADTPPTTAGVGIGFRCVK